MSLSEARPAPYPTGDPVLLLPQPSDGLHEGVGGVVLLIVTVVSAGLGLENMSLSWIYFCMLYL